MPDFASWEATVLEHTYDHVDYISLHAYLGNQENDTANFLAKTLDFKQYIQSIIAVCDYVQAKKRGKSGSTFLSTNEMSGFIRMRQIKKSNPSPWPRLSLRMSTQWRTPWSWVPC